MFVIDRKDREVHEDRIELGDELFVRINEKFHSRFRKPITVMKAGEVCFNVVWESEFYIYTDLGDAAPPIPFYANFNGEYLIREKDELDLSFFDRFDVFVFEDINEYSYHIIRLINEGFPWKKAVLPDEYASCFSDITFEAAAESADGTVRTGHFRSGHILPDQKDHYSVYSLMLSMTWCRKRHYNENAPIDATALLIDFNDGAAGFGDIIKKAQVYYGLAIKHGWIPVMALVNDCQYRDVPGEDCWTKFFEPVSTAALSDIDKYKCVISVSENRPFEMISRSNPYYLDEYFTKPITDLDLKINENTMRMITDKLPKELMTGCVLGVMIRTTDMEMLTGKVNDIDLYIRQIKEHMDQAGDGYDFVFLATEDEYVLDRFKLAFMDKLLYVDQRRIPEESRKNIVSLSEPLGNMYETKYRLGCDYLSAIYGLTACKTVLYNVFAGACYIAQNLKTRIRERSAFARIGQ